MKRYEGKPFTLLGVNSDRDLARLKEICKKEQITWPNFYDKTTSGPIARAWNVSGWPTVYVIDHEGIIRYKDVRGKSLDQAIEALMPKAEAAAKAATEKAVEKTTDK